jgi:hypothetical protein
MWRADWRRHGRRGAAFRCARVGKRDQCFDTGADVIDAAFDFQASAQQQGAFAHAQQAV